MVCVSLCLSLSLPFSLPTLSELQTAVTVAQDVLAAGDGAVSENACVTDTSHSGNTSPRKRLKDASGASAEVCVVAGV